MQNLMFIFFDVESLPAVGAFALLGLGLLLGLKHAVEVDHVVAVSTIVSEHRSLWRSAIVGGLWGVGHTASLVAVGILVLAFRIAIPPAVASWLEFSVALMIILLGALAVLRVLRQRSDVHLHQHSHDGKEHVHIHFHEHGTEHSKHDLSHSHEVSLLGIKPLVVGAVHGLAGSAALTLLVLSQIPSIAVGFLYLLVFGMGSIVGMMLMSGLIGVPFALGSRRLNRINYGLQAATGVISIGFGFWYAYDIGFA